MTKSSTREPSPQPSEQPQPRRRNVYDYDGEYEFPIVQHLTALLAYPPVQRAARPSASARPRQREFISNY